VRRRGAPAWLFVAWGAAACARPAAESPVAPDPPGSTVSSTDGLQVVVVPSAEVPTVVHLTWDAGDAAARSWVEVWRDDALAFVTPVVAGAGVSVPLIGLVAGASHQWRAVTEVGGETRTAEGALEVPAAPPELAVTVTVDTAAQQDAGRYLLTIHRAAGRPSTVVIYDRAGRVLWWREAPNEKRDAHTARPSRDGRSVLYGYYDQTQDDEVGGVYRLPLDGTVGTFTRSFDAHHDFLEHADGQITYLTLDYLRDVSVEGQVVDVISDGLLEVPEGATAETVPREVFSLYRDGGIPLTWVCRDMREGDIFGFHQWSHTNSLLEDPTDPRTLWAMSRYHDNLWQIDRDTGVLLQRLGGPWSDIPIDPAITWSHGHLSQMWDGGFVVFDNNTHRDGPSSVRSYDWDGVTLTQTHQWVGEAQSLAMADAKRLANGNVLIGWGAENRVEERTVDDEVVWRLEYGSGAGGRVTLLTDLYDARASLWAP
jgi:hypothetical protein